jgi:hypothetical protein
MTMKRLRQRLAGGAPHPSFVRLLVAAAIAALGVGSGPALAGGSGPERPPVSAPAKIAPEPAPTAVAPPAPIAQATSPQPSSPQPSTTPARSSAGVTSARPVKPRTERPRAHAARPKPPPPAVRHKMAKQFEAFTEAIQKPAFRIGVAATAPRATDSNNLLFIGGLALLVLVLGDAAFLALSARVLREPTR